MGAALSIVVLFTVTSTIVRVAGVVLEHSGIPRHIARLQAISALMGTDFTTSESELILQTPERRKILIVLMFTGGIGFGSLIATVVVGAFGVSGTTTGLLSQGAAVAIALLYLRYVLLSAWADRLICKVASGWLAKHQTGKMDYLVLFRLTGDVTVGEHVLAKAPGANPKAWVAGAALIPIGTRNIDGHIDHGKPDRFEAGQVVILSGPERAHSAFAAAFGQPIIRKGH